MSRAHDVTCDSPHSHNARSQCSLIMSHHSVHCSLITTETASPVPSRTLSMSTGPEPSLTLHRVRRLRRTHHR
eukprot:2311913-Rhodomonas_salina.1